MSEPLSVRDDDELYALHRVLWIENKLDQENFDKYRQRVRELKEAGFEVKEHSHLIEIYEHAR